MERRSYSNNPGEEQEINHSVTGQLWYIARTKPKAEDQVVRALERLKTETYVPWIKRNKRRDEPLFPGYVFVKTDLTGPNWKKVVYAPGVSYFLPHTKEPQPIADELVAAIRQRVELENRLLQKDSFLDKEQLVITAGPFKGIEAIFNRALTPSGRCLVFLEILGQMVKVEVSAEQLKKK